MNASSRRILVISLAISFLALAGCWGGDSNIAETLVPVPTSAPAPATSVFQLSPSPITTDMLAAHSALRQGSIVEILGGDINQITALLGVHVVQASATGKPARGVAFRIAADGALHSMVVYDHNDVYDPGSDTKPSSWLDTLRLWEKQELAPDGDSLQGPSPQAWTHLQEWYIDKSDGKANHSSTRVDVYRLNTNNTQYDWYLFVQQPFVRPYFYDHCGVFHNCGWWTHQRIFNVSLDSGGTLFEHKPTGTITSSSAGFSIGGSLSADSPVATAGFSESWTQPSVTTTDESAPSDNVAKWKESFGGEGAGFKKPPPTSRGSFNSFNASIFRYPASKGSVSAPEFSVQTEWNFHYALGTKNCKNETCTSDVSFAISPGRINPPILSTTLSQVRVSPAGSARFAVVARIPDSAYGLDWAITNDHPGWLNLSQITGSGASTIVVTAEPTASIGSVATLNIDTTPSNGAPSVRSGPLQVNVKVVKPSDIKARTGVLITGGVDEAGNRLFTAERYVPATESFVTTAGLMSTPRSHHIQVTLPSGKVLIAGGDTNAQRQPTASAEVYDPKTDSFSPVGNMSTPRHSFQAVLLKNGKVLVLGGLTSASSYSATDSAELYDPKTQTFQATGSMHNKRFGATAILLDNGQVLVVGGKGTARIALASAEIYNPATGTFSPIADMYTARFEPTATKLPSGQILIAGGVGADEKILNTGVVYSPATGIFTGPLNDMCDARAHFSASLLTVGPRSGYVLFAGGYGGVYDQLTTLDSMGWYKSGGFDCADQFTPNLALPIRWEYLIATTMTHGPQAGDILYATGENKSGVLAKAILFDPHTLTFKSVGNMTTPRMNAGISELR